MLLYCSAFMCLIGLNRSLVVSNVSLYIFFFFLLLAIPCVNIEIYESWNQSWCLVFVFIRSSLSQIALRNLKKKQSQNKNSSLGNKGISPNLHLFYLLIYYNFIYSGKMTLIKENPILKECPGQQQYKQKTCINYNKHIKNCFHWNTAN